MFGSSVLISSFLESKLYYTYITFGLAMNEPLAPVLALSDDESGSVARGSHDYIPPIQALSDDEQVAGKSRSFQEGLPVGSSGQKRSRASWQPDPRLRSVLSKVLQSRCKCCQSLRQRQNHRSCFHQFSFPAALDQLIQLRNKVRGLHKSDSDRTVTRQTEEILQNSCSLVNSFH